MEENERVVRRTGRIKGKGGGEEFAVLQFCSILSTVLRTFLFLPLSCGIPFLQNQAVCAIWKLSGKFQCGLRFSYVILCDVYT